MTSTVHATGRASPFVLTYVAEILPLSESLELKICAIHLHSSLRAMNGVFSRGTDKFRQHLPHAGAIELMAIVSNAHLPPVRELPHRLFAQPRRRGRVKLAGEQQHGRGGLDRLDVTFRDRALRPLLACGDVRTHARSAYESALRL